MLQSAISAILLADSLLAQFTEVGRRLVTEAKDADTDAMAALIPEANRVFSGAWEQLDHARAELVAGGRDTRAYDLIRSAQGASVGFGVLDSTSQRQLDPLASVAIGGVATRITTMVKLNTAGETAARTASATLKQLVPADWAELARQADQPHVELRSGPGLKKLAWAAAAVLAIVIVYAAMR